MLDQELIKSFAFLDGVEKLVDSQIETYSNPDHINSIISFNYRDLDSLLAAQSVVASNTLFYNAIAARLATMFDTFEETIFNSYMAHCRHYAGMYLTHIDKRATVDALKDYCIRLFSKHTSKEMKVSYAGICFDIHLGKAAATALKANNETYVKQFKEFYTEMYKYERESSRCYEDVIKDRANFDYKRKLAESLADAMKTQNIAICNIVKLRLQGSGEPSSVTENRIAGFTYSHRE